METIDKGYFKNFTDIPNIDKDWIGVQKVMLTLTEDFLRCVFGYDLYKKIVAADPADASTDYGKLLYGTEWELSDIDYKWDGLFNTKKVGPLSDYIFYEYTKDNWIISGNSGAVKPVTELSQISGEDFKLMTVHNRMEKQIQSLYDYMYNSGLYTDNFPTRSDYPYVFLHLNSVGL